MKSNSVCNIIAELSRPRERVQWSTTSKKIYLSTHPRKFGYDVSVLRPSVSPLGVRDGNQLSARRGEEYVIFCRREKVRCICATFVYLCVFSWREIARRKKWCNHCRLVQKLEKIVMATNNSGLNSTYLLISEERRELRER